MKRTLLALGLLIAIPLIAEAHPGRTADDGSHVCWFNCEYWGVRFGRRHYHPEPSQPRPSVSQPLTYPTPLSARPRQCKQYGIGSVFNFITRQCECTEGYRTKSDGTRCITNMQYCEEFDVHAEWSAGRRSCICEHGWVPDPRNKRCIRDLWNKPTRLFPLPKTRRKPSHSSQCPPNSYIIRGFAWPTDEEGEDVVTSKCQCRKSYHSNSAKTQCVKDAYAHPYSTSTQGYNDHCDDAYRWCGNYCRLKLASQDQGVCMSGCEHGALACEDHERRNEGCWAFRINCEKECGALSERDVPFNGCISACRQSYRWCF